MYDLNCIVCGKNFLSEKLDLYPIIVNNNLVNICRDCYYDIVGDPQKYVNISVIFSENKDYKFLNEINISLLLKNSDFTESDVINYNNLSDNQLKDKIRKYLVNFYGGKKLIMEKLNILEFIDFKIEGINFDRKTICSVCGMKIDSVIYFINRNNKLEPICKKCNKYIFENEKKYKEDKI